MLYKEFVWNSHLTDNDKVRMCEIKELSLYKLKILNPSLKTFI
jgi:hypothetical protein